MYKKISNQLQMRIKIFFFSSIGDDNGNIIQNEQQFDDLIRCFCENKCCTAWTIYTHVITSTGIAFGEGVMNY